MIKKYAIKKAGTTLYYNSALDEFSAFGFCTLYINADEALKRVHKLRIACTIEPVYVNE